MNQTVQRVALVTPNLGRGGAQGIVLTLAEALGDLGYQVDLVVFKRVDNDLLEDKAADKFSLVSLDVTASCLIIPSLVQYLWKNCPSVLMSTQWRADCVAAIACFLSKKDVRHVARASGALPDGWGGDSVVWRLVYGAAMRWAYQRANERIALSAGAAENVARAARMPVQSMTVIHNPLPVDLIRRKGQEAVDHPWYAVDGYRVVIAVGRLDPVKDFPTLIRAVSLLSDDPSIRLVILGDGPRDYQEYLQGMIRDLNMVDKVALPGFVANPHAWISKSSVFVLSSLHESFGSVLAEALINGIPVVSTSCPGGPADILEEGKWGEMVPVGDAHAMASAIKSTLDGKRLGRDELMRRGDQFSLSEILPEYLRVLGLGHG